MQVNRRYGITEAGTKTTTALSITAPTINYEADFSDGKVSFKHHEKRAGLF